jgi:outer membrane protein
MLRPSALGALLPALLLTPILARADRKLSLAEATELALRNNNELKLEDEKLGEAEAKRKGVRGMYGPKLLSEANLLVWDSPAKFALNIDPAAIVKKVPPDQLLTLAKYTDLLLLFPSLLDFGNVRDQITGQISATLAQPLTPLLQIHNGYKATEHLSASQALDRDAKKLDVVYRVKDTYLRLVQTQRMSEVAKTGVDQVAEHLKRARQFLAAGLIGKQDVLKAELELARARQRVIRATYGISLASSALAMLMGLSLDETITPTEQVSDPPPPLPTEMQQLMKRAAELRPELKSIERKHAAAEADRSRTKWDLLPQISAVAQYQYTRGQSAFMPVNTFFFGGVMKWEIWDWGGKLYAIKQAAARAAQAELGQRLMRDGVALQTKKAYLDLKQSEEALTVARAAISEAEENFRIEQRRFAVNANTSTDVLDAQLALTRAKLSYTSALYGYYIARVALEQAVGTDKL